MLLTSDRIRPWVVHVENKDVQAQTGLSPMARRKFLSASAVTAVAVPLISGTALAGTADAAIRPFPDPGLRALLEGVDPNRIQAPILRLGPFRPRPTPSSPTGPVR